jgi:hypothetical protein
VGTGDRGYAGCWIPTSEKTPSSRHFGEYRGEGSLPGFSDISGCYSVRSRSHAFQCHCAIKDLPPL